MDDIAPAFDAMGFQGQFLHMAATTLAARLMVPVSQLGEQAVHDHATALMNAAGLMPTSTGARPLTSEETANLSGTYLSRAHSGAAEEVSSVSSSSGSHTASSSFSSGSASDPPVDPFHLNRDCVLQPGQKVCYYGNLPTSKPSGALYESAPKMYKQRYACAKSGA